MQRLKSLLVGLGSLAVGVLFVWLAVATVQQAPQYPLGDKLANEPAPWTKPGKWGKRGNWGRWGEEDKRGPPGRAVLRPSQRKPLTRYRHPS